MHIALIGERESNFEIHTPPPLGPESIGLKPSKLMQSLKHLLLLDINQSNCWHDYNKHSDLYQNCENQGSRVRGSVASVGLQWFYSENASFRIVKFMAPWPGVLVLGGYLNECSNSFKIYSSSPWYYSNKLSSQVWQRWVPLSKL